MESSNQMIEHFSTILVKSSQSLVSRLLAKYKSPAREVYVSDPYKGFVYAYTASNSEEKNSSLAADLARILKTTAIAVGIGDQATYYIQAYQQDKLFCQIKCQIMSEPMVSGEIRELLVSLRLNTDIENDIRTILERKISPSKTSEEIVDFYQDNFRQIFEILGFHKSLGKVNYRYLLDTYPSLSMHELGTDRVSVVKKLEKLGYFDLVTQDLADKLKQRLHKHSTNVSKNLEKLFNQKYFLQKSRENLLESLKNNRFDNFSFTGGDLPLALSEICDVVNMSLDGRFLYLDPESLDEGHTYDFVNQLKDLGIFEKLGIKVDKVRLIGREDGYDLQINNNEKYQIGVVPDSNEESVKNLIKMLNTLAVKNRSQARFYRQYSGDDAMLVILNKKLFEYMNKFNSQQQGAFKTTENEDRK